MPVVYFTNHIKFAVLGEVFFRAIIQLFSE